MDFSTILLLAGIALLVYNNSNKTDDLKQELEDYKKYQGGRDDDQDKQLEDNREQNNPTTLAEKYLRVVPHLQFREITGTKWSGQFRVAVYNNSPDKVFIIKRVSIPLYSCLGANGVLLPYKDVFYTLRPGQSTTFAWAYDVEMFFGDKREREFIQERLRSDKGNWISGCYYNITLIVANASNQNVDEAIFDDVPGDIRVEDTASLYYNDNSGKVLGNE